MSRQRLDQVFSVEKDRLESEGEECLAYIFVCTEELDEKASRICCQRRF